jgi:hypothetical protein
MLSNKATNPAKILQARLNAAKRSFYSICTNCRIVGITNVNVKLLLVNALVRVVFSCMVVLCMRV